MATKRQVLATDKWYYGQLRTATEHRSRRLVEWTAAQSSARLKFKEISILELLSPGYSLFSAKSIYSLVPELTFCGTKFHDGLFGYRIKAATTGNSSDVMGQQHHKLNADDQPSSVVLAVLALKNCCVATRSVAIFFHGCSPTNICRWDLILPTARMTRLNR